MRITGTILLASILAVMALIPRNACAQSVWDDMPSAGKVKRAISGNNEIQTIGRQCAAFSRLESMIKHELSPSSFSIPPAGKTLLGEYRSAVMRDRFFALNKDNDAQNRWFRMCHNMQTGAYVYEGNSGPKVQDALDKRVTAAEFDALLGPKVLAALKLHSERAKKVAQAESSRLATAEKLRKSEARQFAEMILPVAFGVPMILLSIIGAIFVGRRRFRRLNKHGVEIFNSYSDAVGSNLLEGIVFMASVGLGILGVVILILF